MGYDIRKSRIMSRNSFYARGHVRRTDFGGALPPIACKPTPSAKLSRESECVILLHTHRRAGCPQDCRPYLFLLW
jgi:hypothetical protein